MLSLKWSPESSDEPLSLQDRTDGIADDLLSGERRYAALDAGVLAKLLWVRSDDAGWQNQRAWVKRSDLPPGDYSKTPEGLQALDMPWWKLPDGGEASKSILAAGRHYSLYEAQAEEALIRKGYSRDGLLGWFQVLATELHLKSSSGIALRFVRLTSDGIHFELLSPYIDGLDFDHREYHELRFLLEPYDWSLLEEQGDHDSQIVVG